MILRSKITLIRLASIALCLVATPFLFGQNQEDSVCVEGAKTLDRLYDLNDPDEVIASIEQLLPEMLEAQCWEIYTDCFNNLSVAYYNKRDYQGSKESAQKAAEVAATYLGKELQYAAAIANLSVFEGYAKSVELQKESLQIEREFGSDYEALVYAIEGLGLTYQESGDYDTAVEYFKQATEIIRSNRKSISHEEGRLLRQIGNCYLSKNQYAEALFDLEQCIAILDQLPDDKYFRQTRWYAYRDIAEAYARTNKYEKALSYAKAAVDLQKDLELLKEYKAWITIGDIFFAQGKYKEALLHYNKAKEESQKEFKDYRYKAELSEPYRAIAKVHRKTKDYQSALQFYRQAFEMIAIDFKAEEVKDNPPIESLVNTFEALEIFEGKANALFTYYQTNQEEKLLIAAHETWMEAVQLIHSIRMGYLAEGSKHTLLEKVHPLYEKAISTAFQLYQLTGNKRYEQDALKLAESSKSVLLYESMKDRAAKKFAKIPEHLLEEEMAIRTERGFYRTLLLEEKQKKESFDQSLIKRCEKKLFSLNESYQELTKTLEDQYPLYQNSKQQIEPATLENIQGQLAGSRTAIIEFMIGAINSYAFFITEDQFFVIQISTQSELADKVKKLYSIISRPPPENEAFRDDYLLFSKLAHQLYEELLKEGLGTISNKIDQLVIIPDDVLNYLPFEILTVQGAATGRISYKELPYLFKEYGISYNYSASLASLIQDQTELVNGGPSFIGFAPSFGEKQIADSRSCADEKLSNLFCNKEEVISIQENWGGSVFVDEEATVDAFNQEAPNYQIVHLATHACLNESEAALNKIFFSNEDYLTQEELSNLELRSALTVLSACNTGSGQLLKGEGVMSLARCFLLAGSKSILTSFWSVDDCATSTIMESYYGNLKREQAKNHAIALAKLAYLAKADQNNSHPYYWAAFVQFGDINALAGPGRKHWIYLALIALLLLGLWVKKPRRRRG